MAYKTYLWSGSGYALDKPIFTNSNPVEDEFEELAVKAIKHGRGQFIFENSLDDEEIELMDKESDGIYAYVDATLTQRDVNGRKPIGYLVTESMKIEKVDDKEYPESQLNAFTKDENNYDMVAKMQSKSPRLSSGKMPSQAQLSRMAR